jgi:hypothetical protein
MEQDHTPVRKRQLLRGRQRTADICGGDRVGIPVECAGVAAKLQDLAQAAARPGLLGGQGVHLPVAFVGEQKAPIGVEHHDTLRHILQCSHIQQMLLVEPPAHHHDGQRDAEGGGNNAPDRHGEHRRRQHQRQQCQPGKDHEAGEDAEHEPRTPIVPQRIGRIAFIATKLD